MNELLVALNETVFVPEAILTVEGTLRTELELERMTVRPLLEAFAVARAVQAVELFGPMVVGEQVSEARLAAKAPGAVARSRKIKAPIWETVFSLNCRSDGTVRLDHGC